MANFYTDNPEIESILLSNDLKRITDIRENGYAEADQYPYAPRDAEDAIDNYKRVLELAGEITGDFVAPRAEDVDREGNTLEDGDVRLHPHICESIEQFRKAGLMGVNIPRKYGGLFMPNIVKTAFIEMVARADASLMNIVGLQDIAETINEFAPETIKNKYLPPMCSGEHTGAMVLTEPDAGSDLQRVMLRATPPQDGSDDGVWCLSGVKRFITNGCADTLLVLARSEEGTTDGRGLSMFVASKGEGIRIRRIEDKLGIHGSPTCEMQFDNAPARLVGKRKRGLTKYVMALMNGARLGIAGQGLGIAEAAFREAREYASTREQFGRKIQDMPAVYDMLATMKTTITAARVLTYKTAEAVDLYKAMEMFPDQYARKEVKTLERVASVLTPFAKYYATEICNTVAYDAISVLGGSGFMRDYPSERHMRDARITNIYEGTSQLQVIGALGGVLAGHLTPHFDAFFSAKRSAETKPLVQGVSEGFEKLGESIAIFREQKNQDFTDYYARRLVDIALELYTATLLIDLGETSPAMCNTAAHFCEKMMLNVNVNAKAIARKSMFVIDNHTDLISSN